MRFGCAERVLTGSDGFFTLPRMFRRLVIFALIPVLATGCSSSKWAIEDPVYAEKYDRPYEDGEKLPRMAKQIVDARHLAGRTGKFIGGAYSGSPRSQSGSIGTFGYGDAGAVSTYIAGHMSHTDFDSETLLGLETGARVQSPSRLAPFAGAGATGGLSADEVGKTVAIVVGVLFWLLYKAAVDDDDDDDSSNFVSSSSRNHHQHDDDDDDDGVSLHYSPFAAVYPELGLHYWLNHQTRLTLSARYMVTTAGRDHDFWMYGLSLGFLDEPHPHGDEVPVEPAIPVAGEIGEVLNDRWEATTAQSGLAVKDSVDQAVAEVQAETAPEPPPTATLSELPEGSYWVESLTDRGNTAASRSFLKSPEFNARPK